jgi:hypothetical protein
MAPRDDDKAMDGLLRRSLARDSASGDTCPEPDILAAYYERSLDADEMARQERHFSQCSRCREQLAAIFRAKSVADIPAEVEVMDAAEMAPRAATPSRAAAGEPKRDAHPGIFDWRWLAPVAAAILLVVFLYGRNASRPGKPSPSGNQIAMTKPEAVVPSELMDKESSAQHPAAPMPTPPEPRAKSMGKFQEGAPAPKRELPKMARNAAPTAPSSDQPRNSTESLHSEYESRKDLKKRAESTTSAATEKRAPAQLDSYSAAKKEADVAPPAHAPSAAPAPNAAASAQGQSSAEARGGVAGQKSMIGGVANGRKQKQAAADADVSTNVTVMSQAITVQSAAPIIQTPDPVVQYRIPGAGLVERSDDGGATWQGQRVKANAEILAGAAPSVNVCWLVGRGGLILMTSDGKKWRRIPSPAVVDFVEVTASDATFATVTAEDGRKFSTQDSGRTWQLMQ